MKKLLFALLFVVLTFSGAAFAGDGSNYRELQETGVFFNSSGHTLSGGDAVILETNTADTDPGTTLGAYITDTTSSDSVLALGVIAEQQTSCPASTPCIVVLRGPVDAHADDSNDAITVDTAVGTTGVLGRIGGGTNLGVALEAGGGTDGESIVIWVNPTGAD